MSAEHLGKQTSVILFMAIVASRVLTLKIARSISRADDALEFAFSCRNLVKNQAISSQAQEPRWLHASEGACLRAGHQFAGVLRIQLASSLNRGGALFFPMSKSKRKKEENLEPALNMKAE